MALDRVGFGAVFLAPNKRFILLISSKTWGLSKGGMEDQLRVMNVLPAPMLKVEISAKPRSLARALPRCGIRTREMPALRPHRSHPPSTLT